ncbi:MAG: hypothetical protein ACOC2W_03510 [bacterium]
MEITILILSIIILLLVLCLLYVLKKTKFLSDSEIELIIFVLDIYRDYGSKLELYDKKNTK